MTVWTSDECVDVEIASITTSANDIKLFELAPAGGDRLPAYNPGAHVDVHLPNGMRRQYSMAVPDDNGRRYLIGVKRDPASRGGSACMHDDLRIGQALRISRPRNHFPLVESAERSVLIAGGIGITPIWCMAQRLAAIGRPWRLVYAARRRAEAAFLDDIAALGGDVRLHFDEQAGGPLDIAEAVGELRGDTHAYCCGPAGMLSAFRQACAGHYDDCVHVEYFSSDSAPDTSGGYEVELARSGRTLPIAAGQTILQAVLDAGIDHPYACEQGICGACEVRVIDGEPDHRDMVLTPDERAAGRTMMICCSGSRGPKIVIDI
ncbi:PDR/VanB family oxidoreductase [Oceanibacterium hippocampi]|uniref:Phenoxybenzoate dioxygenase subunit beta n=1 Tax=Oceanibacterium hippocampi TaxID=745714 RepID=A0A1Y5RTS9_9PROT|nr:PDR/VanB family oxidoreductase [Oceanibacterium hippocampi]SLN24209.1 Phenoxybenzoate dioxygenase subunit beta [Oceanibacterium hippocampi]